MGPSRLSLLALLAWLRDATRFPSAWVQASGARLNRGNGRLRGGARPGRHGPALHGMFMLDALLGLVLIVAIAGALGAVVARQQRAAIATTDARARVRAVENALTLLQSRRVVPSDIAIKQLDGPAPAGWRWVQAESHGGSRAAILMGLVPSTGGNP